MSLRLALFTLLASAALLGGFGAVVAERAADERGRASRAWVDALAELLVGSYESVEPSGHGHAAAGLARSLAEAKPIAELEIVDHEGAVVWSLDPARTGARLKIARSPDPDEPATPPGERLIPIRAKPSCGGCHPSGADPVGAIRIRAREHGSPRSTPPAVALAGAALALPLALLVGLYLRLRVVGPLARLLETARRAEEGDYFLRSEVRSNDEVGQMAGIVNKLLAKITSLKVDRIEGDRTLEEISRELALKAALAEKSDALERTYKDLSRRHRDLTFLYSLSRELAAELDVAAIADRLEMLVTRSLEGVTSFSALVYDPELRAFTPGGRRGEGHALATAELDGTPSGRAIAERQPVYVPAKGERGAPGSTVVVPVVHRGEVLAVLSFASERTEAFSDEERELIATIGHHASLALANARLFATTKRLSMIDGLTATLNRRALEERLDLEWENSARYRHPLSLAMIDIDHFKRYNDDFGHQLGDEVLRRVATVLTQNLRKGDALGRYGGEEFVAVLPHTDEAEARATAEKLRRAVEGIRLDQGGITISVGIASHPTHAKNLLALVSVADEALLRAKRAGRNRVEAPS